MKYFQLCILCSLLSACGGVGLIEDILTDDPSATAVASSAIARTDSPEAPLLDEQLFAEASHIVFAQVKTLTKNAGETTSQLAVIDATRGELAPEITVVYPTPSAPEIPARNIVALFFLEPNGAGFAPLNHRQSITDIYPIEDLAEFYAAVHANSQ